MNYIRCWDCGQSIEMPVGYMKSPCSSNKHQEYSCMIRWGVSGFKFTADKWCEGCKIHYKESIEKEGSKVFNVTKSRGKGKTSEESGTGDDGS